jgi:hypothetical protein
MSMLATTIIKELGIMHLVTKSESYKTASSVVMQALEGLGENSLRLKTF